MTAMTARATERLTWRQLIWSDIAAWKRRGFAGGRTEEPLRPHEALALVWRFAGLRATLTYRLSHEASRRRIPLLPGLLARRNIRRYGLDIVPGVPIGPGLYIPHPVGTVVMAEWIGRDCALISGVTIGLRGGAEPRPAFPRVGDGVTFGCGARALGAITIGDGVTLGANAVLLADAPAGATLVGAPARVVGRRFPPTRSYAIEDEPAPQFETMKG